MTHASPSPTYGVSRGHWLSRGCLVGFLLGASGNTGSFFARSGGLWGSLLGRPNYEAIGLPWEMWNSRNRAIQWDSALGNATFVAGLALACGALAWSMTIPLTRLARAIEIELREKYGEAPPPRLQFSLKGLLLLTVVVGMLAMLVRAAGPDALAAVYLLGPAAMLTLVLLPRGLSLPQRAAMLGPMSLSLMAAAIFIGYKINVYFEKVLLGIAVSWTTQCSFAALLLTTGLLIARRHAMFPKHA